ncbi:MAG TPA: ATPase domain-containing protein [Polyangiales bacterium]|nr:ATPase domain-containing protein [Polyangiales bacterium]
MNTSAQSGPKLSSGIDGLDNVLEGGFLQRGFYLIQGDPGSGKTTLALQYILSRLRLGERCLYVTLTESRRDLEGACASHGWSLGGLELVDLTRSATLDADSHTSVFHPADTELTELTNVILAAVARVKPQQVVFDGLAELRLLSGDPLRYRRQLLSLKEFFARQQATVLLLDDRSGKTSEMQPESLVGGNIVLEYSLPAYGRARRRLFVSKVRGSRFREGYHDYDIVRGGVQVHPRLVAAEHHTLFEKSLHSSGIPNLDAMLHGGLHDGSTTLLVGPAGVGKSTLSMQFVVEAMKRGKKAAVYAFDEVLHILIERSEKLCIGKAGGFQSYVDDSLLHAQQVDPAELSPGAFAQEVRRAVDAGASVVVIDSLNGYLSAMPEEGVLTTHLHELFAYLNQQGVLTIIVVAQHGMIPGPSSLQGIHVSYLADTVLLFRYYEAPGEICQAVGVSKKRTGSHERALRQLWIDASGVHVGEPLRHMLGISGVPQYASGAYSPE